MKTWRVLTDGSGGSKEAQSAGDIVDWLWTGGGNCLWAEPDDGGPGAFPQDVPEVRDLLLSEPTRVARSFLGKSHVWVFEWVMELAQKRPTEALPVVKALVDVAVGDEELAYVAAGPIEDLLAYHGPAVIDTVEHIAREDTRFRRALTGVWRSDIQEEVWNRMRVIVGEGLGLDG